MAVEMMMGAYKSSTGSFTATMEENEVREAAAAGLQNVEKLIKLLSQNHHHHLQDQQQATQDYTPASNQADDTDYKVVADLAVNKFKKVISLLDRSRTGHARFRRGPLLQQPKPQQPQAQPIQVQPPSPPQPQQQLVLESKPSQGSAFRRVYSSSSQIQRLPPLPHSNHPVQHPHHSPPLGLPKPIERKDNSTTINFSSSPPISATNSYISSLTGDTDSVQPSMSSGFQITNLSQVSSAGKPPLSSSSFKRKCNSMDDSKCGGSSGRCHCPKRRRVTSLGLDASPSLPAKQRRLRWVRVPPPTIKLERVLRVKCGIVTEYLLGFRDQ